MIIHPLTPLEVLGLMDSLSAENGAWEKHSHQPKNTEELERCLRSLKEAGGLARRLSKVFCNVLRRKPLLAHNRRCAIAIVFAIAAKNNHWLNATPAELLWLVKLPEGRPAQWEAAEDAAEGFFRHRLAPLTR